MSMRSLCSAALSTAGWSDAAIRSAANLSVQQRKRLRSAGVLDVQRPFKIRAERATSTTKPVSRDVNSKVIHFQRHGQGYHNLLGDVFRDLGQSIDLNNPDPSQNPFVRPEIVDSPLTEVGRMESAARRVEASTLNPDLVIVSPLHRAIQTAQITFSDHRGRIPWLAHEGCREEMGLLICNKRRPLSDTVVEFPGVDFSHVTSGEEDTLFLPDRRETELEKSERAYTFMVNFLRQRPEKEVAVVGHSAWLFTLANAVMDCGNDDSLSAWWLTSEVRSMRVTFE